MSKVKKIDVVVGLSALALVVGGVFATRCYYGGNCGFGETQASAASPAEARELLSVARGHATAELRSWLLAKGPDVANRTVLSLDNTTDPSAQARLLALRTIYSLSSEGLPDESVKAWAFTLRSLANAMLHEGPERADCIARSYLMEGRSEAAASEYAHYPKSDAAQRFFGENPDARAPASRGKDAGALRPSRPLWRD